ncbi:hypothetical protein BZG36_03709 [Bifiguratus adelaidae]|uniref:Arrestin C-terminal-like domain-containing protein n=1 Tax=Bifiguratus adelaidae TaxID=1938954 RepID=A0A261XXH7_9FUNG|nr:hypothetical protein BZG36_03709 [Bifiguratus adelaidae]
MAPPRPHPLTTLRSHLNALLPHSESTAIQEFRLDVQKSAKGGGTVVFGPGSCINGSVSLVLSKPVRARALRVVLKCTDWQISQIVQQQPEGNGPERSKSPKGSTRETVLFESEGILWGEVPSLHERVIEAGRKIYLFAFRLPMVNYCPSLDDPHHKIIFSLQAFLDPPSSPSPGGSPALSTPGHQSPYAHDKYALLPHTTHSDVTCIDYVPLVPPLSDQAGRVTKGNTWTSAKGDEKVEGWADIESSCTHLGDTFRVNVTLINGSTRTLKTVTCSIVSKTEDLVKGSLTYKLCSTNMLNIQVPPQKSPFPRKNTPFTCTFNVRIPQDILPSIPPEIKASVHVTYELKVRVAIEAGLAANVLNGLGTTGASSSLLDEERNKKALVIVLPLHIGTLPPTHPALAGSTAPLPTLPEGPCPREHLPRFEKSESYREFMAQHSKSAELEHSLASEHRFSESSFDAPRIVTEGDDSRDTWSPLTPLSPLPSSPESSAGDEQEPVVIRQDEAGYLMPPKK